MRRRVGILGGMGPEATVLLMQKVIDAVPAEDDADHIPLLVDQNPQVPSRIARLLEGTGADPAPALLSMAERLQGAGAEALAMPCNTAHHYAQQIAAAVDIPLLDMVSLAVSEAADRVGGTGRVGILCSPAVRRVGLFDAALAEKGMEPAYPRDEAALLAAIRQIKAEGPVALARATLAAASSDLFSDGAEVQLIACTEFSLISSAVPEGVLAIDTLDRLVSEIISFSMGQTRPSATVAARRSSAAAIQDKSGQQGKEVTPC